jgi:hypothetical protein
VAMFKMMKTRERDRTKRSQLPGRLCSTVRSRINIMGKPLYMKAVKKTTCLLKIQAMVNHPNNLPTKKRVVNSV